ncbi:MAG: hypothetical protein ABJE95_34375, partial [Byssovorax sp.]
MSARKVAKKVAEKAPSSRGRVVRLAREGDKPGAALGPGAHFAKLFKKLAEGRYEAHLISGELLEIRVAPEVDLALADRCLAEQEIVLVGARSGEAVLFGALRTKEEKKEDVVLEAGHRLVLKAGKAKLEL